MRAKCGVLYQTHGVRLRAKFRLDRFILLPSVGEKSPIFAVFWTWTFSVVASWQQSDKVEHGAQLQAFPIQRHQNWFCTPTPSWRNRTNNL